YQDILLSGVDGQEDALLALMNPRVRKQGDWEPLVAEIQGRRKPASNQIEQAVSHSERVLAGKKLYNRHCSGCHQQDGRGRIPVAPPLRQSEWVLGHPERLTMIALLGLQGPITVNGQRYEPPHIAPHMPGLKDNQNFSSADIAAILSYVRNAWGHQASEIEPEMVARVRREQAARQEMCTEPELLSWPGR
ncbi:MAG: cytochrome c, partial [Bacteroidota bacterium]